MLRWYRSVERLKGNNLAFLQKSVVGALGFLLAFSIAFADDVNVVVNVTPTTTTTTTTIPSYGLRATMLAIAQINPLATLILLLMPVIIGEFLVKNFEEIKVNEPLKAVIRLLIIIISLALFAAVF
jgi:uncharacterized protein YqhQ